MAAHLTLDTVLWGDRTFGQRINELIITCKRFPETRAAEFVKQLSRTILSFKEWPESEFLNVCNKILDHCIDNLVPVGLYTMKANSQHSAETQLLSLAYPGFSEGNFSRLNAQICHLVRVSKTTDNTLENAVWIAAKTIGIQHKLNDQFSVDLARILMTLCERYADAYY